jgi:nucleotide-binding universal stress UspA family protein
MISRIDPDRELYEAALQDRRDKAAIQQAGRAETQRANIRALQESLGQDVTSLEELHALSWNELENIWARLQADLRALANRK